jgi:ABC-type nitrate/sulfonate/bicarbonate transport system permease component
MLSNASENPEISACSTANALLEVALGFCWAFCLGFALGLLHCLQIEAARALLMTLHITELALDTFGLVLGRRFVFKDFLLNEFFLPV